MKAPDPIAFTVMGYPIMWYGILIGMGILLAVLISYKRASRHGIEQDRVFDLVIWMLPAGVIGARLYYVIFSWENYSDDLISIFDIRGGGLAIHGGIIAGFIATYLVTRHYKIELIEMCDLFFPVIALAQAIGRWGNFFNSEAHGGPTDLPWAILVNGEYVHPTFLYESLWCFGLFIFLIYIDNRRSFKGQVACLYGILYSLERFFVEGLRTDSLMIGEFRQAQVISGTILIVCAVIYIILRKKSIEEKRK